jgi:hypothetical protein
MRNAAGLRSRSLLQFVPTDALLQVAVGNAQNPTHLSSWGPATSYSCPRQDAFTLMRALCWKRAQDPGFTCSVRVYTHRQAVWISTVSLPPLRTCAWLHRA